MKPKALMFKDIIIYFLLAFFICFLSVFIISFVSFKKLYQQSIEETSITISGSVKAEENKYANIVYSLAVWNQSYQNIYLNYNPKWIEENIVYDLEKSHDISFFSIINAETNEVLYSTDSKLLEKGKIIPDNIKNFLNAHNKDEGQETARSEIIKIYSAIYLLSTAAISEVNYADHQSSVKPTKLRMLIGSALNETFLQKIAQTYNLTNLQFYPLDQMELIGNQPSYILNKNNQDLGYITWLPRDRTKGLLMTIVPTGFIVIFLMSLVGLLIARKLARVSYNYEQMVGDLSELATNLEKEKTETSHSLEAKNHFLAMMSHQIRTPMTGVVGMISLLKETELTDAQIKYVNTMEFSADSLLRLVDSILEFSRLESEEVSLSFANMNIRQLIDEVHGLLLPVALQRKLKFEVFFSQDVPLIIRSDAIRLRQIILHLVTNALKFTKVGSIKINVSAIPLSDMKTDISIQVIDTGVGIAEGLRQSLFEEFFKTDNGKQQSVEGIGLGLAIVRSLTNLLQGTAGVASKLGQGSTFWVQFPADVVERYDSGGSHSQAKKEKLKFLVIDEIGGAETNTLPILLESLRHEARIASSIDEIIEKFKDESFSAIFIDLSSEKKDDYSLPITEKLRLTFFKAQVPIIAMIHAEDNFSIAREVYDHVLVAPITARKLGDLIAKLNL